MTTWRRWRSQQTELSTGERPDSRAVGSSPDPALHEHHAAVATSGKVTEQTPHNPLAAATRVQNDIVAHAGEAVLDTSTQPMRYKRPISRSGPSADLGTRGHRPRPQESTWAGVGCRRYTLVRRHPT